MQDLLSEFPSRLGRFVWCHHDFESFARSSYSRMRNPDFRFDEPPSQPFPSFFPVAPTLQPPYSRALILRVLGRGMGKQVRVDDDDRARAEAEQALHQLGRRCAARG